MRKGHEKWRANPTPHSFFILVSVLHRPIVLVLISEKGSLPAHDMGDLKAVCALGTTHFVTCGDDGAIAIWKWAQPQADAPSKR